ncbi:hypothetical protein D3C78_1049570 [compost metagenome]
MTLDRIVGDSLGNTAYITHRHLLGEQRLQDLEQPRQRNDARHQLFGKLGRGLGQHLQQLLDFLVTNQFVAVLVQNLVQVGRNHGTGIHHGVTQRLRLTALIDVDPHRLQPERRVAGGNTVEGAKDLPGVDGQFAIGIDLGLGQDHPHQGQAIGTGRQVEVVTDMHRGHEKTQVLGELLAHPLDPRQQLSTLIAVDQGNQPVADFQADHVDRGDIVPAQLLGFHGALRRGQQVLLALNFFLGFDLGQVLLAPQPIGTASGHQPQAQEGEVRHARHQAHDDHDPRRYPQRLRRSEHLPVDLVTHVFGTGGTGHHDGCSGGQQQ